MPKGVAKDPSKDGRRKNPWNEGGPGSRGGRPAKEIRERNESRYRTEGKEVGKTVWIRKDVWAAVEHLQEEHKKKFGTRITFKELLNEALFDLVFRKKMEILHGQEVKFKDTIYDPEKGTIRKPE